MLQSDTFNHKISADETISVTQVIQNSSYRQAFQTQNRYFSIILLCSTGVPFAKELSNDIMPHPQEFRMQKVCQAPDRVSHQAQ